MSDIDIFKVLEESKDQIEARLEQYIPRAFSHANIETICGKARFAYDIETATKALSEPIWEFLDRGGKRWRPALLLLMAEALGAQKEDVLDFVAICELVHNGTLVIDDIEDQSELRRGKPCLHLVYDLDVAINAGNALYFLPLLALKERKDDFPPETIIKAYELYSQEMINLHFGQGFDICWHSGNKEPNIDEYLQMCAYKTGTLARLSCKLSALLAGASDAQIEAIGRFAESVGVGFQIQDDILNLDSEEFAEGKGFGEDIHEGKRTLIVIHCLENATEEDATRLREILLLHTDDLAVIKGAVEIIHRTESIEFARQRARKIVSSAWDDLESALPESEAKNKLKAFADFLIERNV
jgi:geranylgeranyl pyrophosphate synthase